MINPFNNNRLNNIKITHKPTLFDTDYGIARELRICPWCGNKLLFPRNKKIALCRSPKHAGNTFVVKIDNLKDIP